MHVDVNGTRLWFDVDGVALVPDGARMSLRATVVLLHGGPGSYDHSYLKPDFARLAEVAQVVYVDLRDHGRSSRGDPSQWTFEQCADDLRIFCDALGIARPVVFGHSLGGMVAMLYAARHPGHPSALILQSTMGRFDLTRMVEGFRKLGGDEVGRIAERSYSHDPSVTAEEWGRAFRHFGRWVPGSDEQARKIINGPLNEAGMKLLTQFNAMDQLSRIQCPTMVCVGNEDPVTPVAAAREIVEAMRPGRARLEIVAEAGHFPWRDAPEEYWSLILKFVRAASDSEASLDSGAAVPS